MELSCIFILLISSFQIVVCNEFIGHCQTNTIKTTHAVEKGSAIIGCQTKKYFGFCSLSKHESNDQCVIIFSIISKVIYKDCNRKKFEFNGNLSQGECLFEIKNIEQQGKIFFCYFNITL